PLDKLEDRELIAYQLTLRPLDKLEDRELIAYQLTLRPLDRLEDREMYCRQQEIPSDPLSAALSLLEFHLDPNFRNCLNLFPKLF
ncbi:MAG: hypothetical protein RSA67_07410, partial [Alistipes sp.]